MPRCSCPSATCVIGDFWTCKTIGCVNGPDRKADPAPVRRRTPRDTIEIDDNWFLFDPSDKATWHHQAFGIRQTSGRPGLLRIEPKPGFELIWDGLDAWLPYLLYDVDSSQPTGLRWRRKP